MAWAREQGASTETLDALAVAVTEAAANATMHAYVGRPAGTFELHLEASPEAFEVSVTDCGSGMAARTDSPGLGLGMPLIAKMAQTVEVSRADCGGTRVRMLFVAR